MDDRERNEHIQAGKQLLIRRAKLAAIVLPLVFALEVIDWAWPNAVRQALAPLKMLVGALGR
jgi:hypothetical protein